jgi:hypothetical protein
MSDSQGKLKTYSPPKLTTRTPEQAKLLLIGHATQGDQGARDLLDVLFPAGLKEDDGPLRATEERSRKARTLQYPLLTAARPRGKPL